MDLFFKPLDTTHPFLSFLQAQQLAEGLPGFASELALVVEKEGDGAQLSLGETMDKWAASPQTQHLPDPTLTSTHPAGSWWIL